MRRTSIPAHSATAVAVLLAMASAHVLAEESPQAEPDVSPSVQSVVVTANRRREPAREVPMQLDVISSEAMEKSGAKSLTDLLADLPGVDVKTQGGPGLGAISVRGISTGDQTVATVGTYIDDVAFGSYSAFVNGSFNALQMSLLDLSHVELLRGPQGTLYGAGAMGGLLKYVTTEPDSFELYGKAGVTVSHTKGGAASHTENGVVNVPLKEGVAALRVAAFEQHDGGYVDAVGPVAGNRINGGDTKGVRAALELVPVKELHVRLSVLDQDLKRDGTDFVDYDAATGRPVTEPATRYLVQREPYRSKIRLASADVEYDAASVRFNSITSLQRVDLQSLQDNTSVYAPMLEPDLTVQSVGAHIASALKKATQEFRLTSKDRGSFEWLAGLFLDRESGANNQSIDTILPDDSAGPSLLIAQLPTKFDEAALYGNATWNIDSRLSLTGGMRIAHNRQTFQQIQDGLLVGGATNISSSSSETSKTWLLTGKYALTPTSNVYVRAASGYRPGGPNAVVNDPTTGQPVAPPTFQHDSLWSYEAGYKVDLPASGWSIQTDAFQINWKNIQQFFAVQGITIITNGGDARSRGVELSVNYKQGGFSAAANVAYADAVLTEGSGGLGATGAPLPNSAKVSGSLDASYAFEAAGLPTDVAVTLHGASSRNAGFTGSESLPNYRLPGYALVDAKVGVTWNKLELNAFARNLFNRRAQLSGETTYVPLGGSVMVVESMPLTVGISVSAEFQ